MAAAMAWSLTVTRTLPLWVGLARRRGKVKLEWCLMRFSVHILQFISGICLLEPSYTR